MPTYENKQFIAKCVALYAKTLHEELLKDGLRVKFMLDKDGAVKDAIERKAFRRIGEYRKMALQFAFDDHINRHGNLDQDNLAQVVADGFGDPLIDAVRAELQAETGDQFKGVGAGQLWVLHDTVPFHETNGKGEMAFEEADQVESGCSDRLGGARNCKSVFTARATWTLLRSGEIKKEAINRLDPPPFLQAE